MNKNRTKLSILLIICFLALFVSCDEELQTDGSSSQAGVSFQLKWLDDIETMNRAAQVDCEREGIVNIQGKIINPAGTELKSETWTCTEGKGILYDITPGTNYTVRVLGLDANNIVIYSGEVGGIEIKETGITKAGLIEMRQIDLNSFTITATAGAGGTISPPGEITIAAGESQVYTVTPNENYTIADVLVNGNSVGAIATHTFGNVDEDSTIHATFSEGTPPPGDYVNSLGMTFKRIPAGTFTMGSPTTELGRYDDETQHQVTITNDFYIMTTEVTQKQWQDVVGSNPSDFTACGENCPVEMVSWNDIQTFITAMNALGEGTYRLPTEAEWEYAARAGSTTAFANGGITYTNKDPIDPNLDAMGWYGGNENETTHPVAQKQANAWGLYDMHGNVYEWCQDWYGGYPTTAITDPTGANSGIGRVLRGGSWSNHALFCRSANRVKLPSGIQGGGFRLVCLQVSI